MPCSSVRREQECDLGHVEWCAQIVHWTDIHVLECEKGKEEREKVTEGKKREGQK